MESALASTRKSGPMARPTCATVFAAACIVACLARGDEPTSSAEAQPAKQITLMGMLSEWMYPGSEFKGAKTSDAAVTDISSIKSKALLTTTDSADEVMAFYRKKLNVDTEGDTLTEPEGDRVTTDRSVLIQDISGSSDSALFVICINREKASTTLVVSRSTGEDVTRIAWSDYRQLWP